MSNGQGPLQPGMEVATAGDVIGQGKALQQVRTTYATAMVVQKPRDLDVILNRCIKEAEMCGDSMYYGWGRGDNAIEGPSVKLAMIAIRNYGNAVVEMLPVQETHGAWIFTPAFIDLETGFTLMRQFRQSKKWKVYGKHDDERKMDIRFQIGQSKGTRNLVLNALPEFLIDKMITAAKSGVRKAIENRIAEAEGDIMAVIDKMVIEFEKKDATKEMLEKKIGVKTDKWSIEDLVLLAGDLKALKAGETNADELYGDGEKEEGPAEKAPKPKMEMKPGDASKHQAVDGKPEDGKKKTETKSKPAEKKKTEESSGEDESDF